jgi:hypothetical protein
MQSPASSKQGRVWLMTDRKHSVVMAGIVGASLAVYACLWAAFERPALFEILNAAVIAVAVGVVIGFSLAAWRVFWSPVVKMTGGDMLVLGVWLVWTGLVGAFLMLWVYRLTSDRFWLDAPWTAFTRWLIFAGGVLHLAASGAIDGRIPARAYIRAGIIAGFGAAVALFLISVGVQ